MPSFAMAYQILSAGMILQSGWFLVCGAPPSDAPAPEAQERVQDPAIAATHQSRLQEELARCLQLIRAQRYGEARSRLQGILMQHPAWPRANLLMAITYHKEHRYEEARPLFARVLELDPKEHAARPFYGWCLYYLGEAAECEKMFQSYLDVNPDYSDAHYALGLLAMHRDDTAEAARRFETATQLAAQQNEPRIEGKARARLGDIYARNGELEKARVELEKAVVLRPDAYAAYFKLSRVLQRLGDREGADRARAMHEKIREQVRPTHDHETED